MTNRELKKQLEQLSRTSVGGQVDFVWQQKSKAQLLSQISSQAQVDTPIEEYKPSWQEKFQQAWHQYVLRPSAVVTFSLLIVLSGAATVSASLGAVPGDLLYSLKLTTEETQLFLTANSAKKAKLKIAFAGRRVDELTQIVDDQDQDKINQVVQKFSKDVEEAKTILENSENIDEDVVDAAKELDTKASVYHKNIKLVRNTMPKFLREAVQNSLDQAASVAAVSSHKAVEVLVEASSNQESGVSTEEVLQRLDSKIKDAKEELNETTEELEDVQQEVEKAKADPLASSTAKLAEEAIATSTQEIIQKSEQVNALLDQAEELLESGNLNDALGALNQSQEGVEETQADVADVAAKVKKVQQENEEEQNPDETATSTDPISPQTPEAGEENTSTAEVAGEETHSDSGSSTQ